jgi:Sec-independent protein translocase TatA
MFDSPWEWLIVGLVIVLLFGSAKKIPEFSRNLGRATGEFKRGQAEIEKEIKGYVNGPLRNQRTPMLQALPKLSEYQQKTRI